MAFTIGMINKVKRGTDELVRCQIMLNYLKFLDVKKSLLVIQHLIFYNLMTFSEILKIFKLYRFHLDAVSQFLNTNNIMFLKKALFF